MRPRLLRIGAGLVAMLAIVTSLHAQSAPLPPIVTLQPEEHAQRLAALKLLLAGCVADAGFCNPDRVGPDERVVLPTGITTRIRLGWLRAGLAVLATEKGNRRKALAVDLEARLARLEAPPAPIPQNQLLQARTHFDQVLGTTEFKQEPELTWLQRNWHAFTEWLGRILVGSFDAVSKAPRWIGFFFQALLFIVPALLLMLWLIRQVREDRLHPSRSVDPRPAGALAPQTQWLALAEEFARLNDWRQAIHALYWATIAGFEARRAWQSNRTRTPREYLRLLQPGSAARQSLAEQTRLFELIWYGYRQATHDDYQRARQLESQLEAQ